MTPASLLLPLLLLGASIAPTDDTAVFQVGGAQSRFGGGGGTIFPIIIGPPISGYHAETIDYIARVEAAGGGLTPTQAAAVDVFVRRSISEEWRGNCWYANPRTGTNLAASAVVLFHGTNAAHYAATGLTNEIVTGFTEGDYSQIGGLVPAAAKNTSYGASFLTNMYIVGTSNAFLVTSFAPTNTALNGDVFGAKYNSTYGELFSGALYLYLGNSGGEDFGNRHSCAMDSALTNLAIVNDGTKMHVLQDHTSKLAEAVKWGNPNAEAVFYPVGASGILNRHGTVVGFGITTNTANLITDALDDLNRAIGR